MNEKIKIAFGSDFYQNSNNFKKDFGALAKETLFSYSENGMSNTEVIKSATTYAAIAVGMEGRVGVIKKNAYADLIAISGNPLKNIQELENVKFVMKNGKVIKNEF